MASTTPKRDSKGRFLKAKKPKVYKIGRKIPVQKVHQVGKTTVWKDKQLSALAPGKRISKKGKVYYEYRKNRSDRRGSRL
jgi:hypothetical protein